jgi:hypothetical protein
MPGGLPSLPIPLGVSWAMRKSPRFSTVTQRPVSGARPVSFSTSYLPSWEWELNWSILRDQGVFESNHQSLMQPYFFALQDFYVTMNGSNGRYVFDPAANSPQLDDCFVPWQIQNLPVLSALTDNTMVNGYSGVGTGVQTDFQLFRSTRSTGTLQPAEAIDCLSAICSQFASPPGGPFNVYVDNVIVDPSQYSYSQYPLMVTFVNPPAVGAIISWTGIFAYVAKFKDDKIDFSQWSERLWDLQSLVIEQVPLGY